MQPKDRKPLATAVGALAETFRQTITPATVVAYEMALDDLPIESVERAVRVAMRHCKFFPAAVELRELAGELRPQDRAIAAWDAFERAVVEHGGYKSIEFDDPALTATVRNLGGWQRCCEMPAEEFDKWLRKDFERVYLTMLNRPPDREVGHLVGIHESENSLSGHAIAAPVRVVTGLPAIGYEPRKLLDDQ